MARHWAVLLPTLGLGAGGSSILLTFRARLQQDQHAEGPLTSFFL